jgi:hypothetical protein
MARLTLLIALVMLVVILAGSSASATPDTTTSLTNSNIPDNEVTTSQIEASNASASEEISGFRIDNINKNGAVFHWSTPVATNGSVEYAYTKLAQISGSQQSVAISVLISRTESDPQFRNEHHIRVDNLDMYYHPFVEYTIKSVTRSGEVYTLSGELVLVDTGAIPLSQTLWFTVSLALFVVFLGYIPLIRKYLKSRKTRRR